MPVTYIADENWRLRGRWGEWGACSVTCGGGEQRRYRTCETKNIQGHHSGTVNHCTGSSYRKRRCNTQCCPYTSAKQLHWGEGGRGK
ncbi:HMCN1 [Bugula neritina]|uniref:HMCN1 n=1 Tax=Bugula neritina TaxID=10212 RepID=A0A7J7JJ01_BUGNE|nr:HMCN1 [Bugula neritina]